MKAKLINDDAQKTFALVFDKNDEVVDGLLAFAKQNNLQASHFTAIGAFRRTPTIARRSLRAIMCC